MSIDKERWLLPEGIEEILPPEARRLESLRRRILDRFASWGYELVMPPLIEYLDSLLTGVGSDLELQTFKLTDHMTGRLMGIRPDMTPQAARIDAHFLKRSAPVRLCYTGSVLHARPDVFAGSREPLQLGAELFGHAGPESDAEILSLMLSTIEIAEIERPHLDMGHVGVFRELAAQAGLAPEREAQLFAALQRKARNEVDDLLAAGEGPPAGKRLLASLLDLTGGTEVLARAREIFADAPATVREALDYLDTVTRLMRRACPDIEPNFDLAELSGYRYYTGMVFSVFAPGHGRALAKGGRYDGIGKAFGRDRAATGFGADLRELLRFSRTADNGASGILASYGDDAELRVEIERLRSNGERVVTRLPGDASAPIEFGCDRELVRQDGRWVVRRLG